MLLSCRMLNAVYDVNTYEMVDFVEIPASSDVTVYLQLMDNSKNRSCGTAKSGLRYIPPDTSTLEVTVDHLDPARRVVREATQPFAEDLSIWALSILSSDVVNGSVNLRLALTEPSATYSGTLSGAIRTIL